MLEEKRKEVLLDANNRWKALQCGKQLKCYSNPLHANTPVATLAENTTMFWVGEDGDFITAFSSDEQFSTVESLQKIVPENFELVVVDYTMD